MRYITGEPDRPPSRTGISIGDSLAAMHATDRGAGRAAAPGPHRRGPGRRQRDLRGGARHDESHWSPSGTVAGYQRERTGAILPNVAPSNVYPTADGQSILIAANQDTVFARLSELMGEPELAEAGSRYATHADRGAHQARARRPHRDLDRQVRRRRAARAAARRRRARRADLHGRRTCCATRTSRPARPIVRVPDPTLRRAGDAGRRPQAVRHPGQVRWTGPELGQHNDEVYGDLLGLSTTSGAPARRGRCDLTVRPRRDYAARRLPRPDRLGCSARPCVVVDVVRAYLDEAAPLADAERPLRGRPGERRTGRRGGTRGRAPRRLHGRQAGARRRRRRLVRRQGARPDGLRGGLAVRRLPRRPGTDGPARSWSPSSTPRRSSGPRWPPP